MAIGEKLRGEREARDITIDQISAATGIGRAYLEDFERNAFNALPGRAKFYIRAYAQTLGFDAQKMIDQYDREQEARRPGQPAPPEPERAAPRPVEAAIARWRKEAMASHARTDDAGADAFDEDDLDDGIECEADAIAQARPPASRPGAGPPIPHSADESGLGARASAPQSDLSLGTRASGPQSDLSLGARASAPQSDLSLGARASAPQSDLSLGARASAPQSDLSLGTRAAGPQSKDQPGPPASSDLRTRGPRTGTALDPGPGARTPGELALGTRASGPQSEVPPPRIPRAAPPRSRAHIAASLMVGLIVVLAGIRLIVFKTNADGGDPAPVAAASAIPPPSIPAARAPEPSASPAAEALQPPTGRADPPPPGEERAGTAGYLTVTESGVGRRIVNRRLSGESDTFAPGDVVLFSTLVTGGRRGLVIRHVWIHEGRVQQSIALELGGPDWRTHSRKTLWAEGEWTVEARDSAGDLLAEASFTCVPGN